MLRCFIFCTVLALAVASGTPAGAHDFTTKRKPGAAPGSDIVRTGISARHGMLIFRMEVASGDLSLPGRVRAK